eukprot:gene435-6848_t
MDCINEFEYFYTLFHPHSPLLSFHHYRSLSDKHGYPSKARSVCFLALLYIVSADISVKIQPANVNEVTKVESKKNTLAACDKSQLYAVIWNLTLGVLGGDRLYLGLTPTAVLKGLFGLLGVLLVIAALISALIGTILLWKKKGFSIIFGAVFLVGTGVGVTFLGVAASWNLYDLVLIARASPDMLTDSTKCVWTA